MALGIPGKLGMHEGDEERGKAGRSQTCCSLRGLARGSLCSLRKVTFVLKPLQTNVITLQELSRGWSGCPTDSSVSLT